VRSRSPAAAMADDAAEPEVEAPAEAEVGEAAAEGGDDPHPAGDDSAPAAGGGDAPTEGGDTPTDGGAPTESDAAMPVEGVEHAALTQIHTAHQEGVGNGEEAWPRWRHLIRWKTVLLP